MKQRVISTLLLWAIVILLPLTLGLPGATILVAVFGLLSMIELRDLLNRSGFSLSAIWAPLGGMALLAIAAIYPTQPEWLLAGFFSLLVAGTCCVLLTGTVERFPQQAAAWLLFLCLIPLPFAIAAQMLVMPGIWVFVWILAVAKFTDVGALLTGLMIGKHKMAPRLSPKKTWEGLAGGLVTAVLISALFITLFDEYLPSWLNLVNGLWMAVPVAIAGVLSDLLESALKRAAKVKDSGNRIPGIGGILDLTDSLILSLPVAYILFLIVI
ncbi:MAG: phosphatidate cytidylyltransferase [Opitutales bacterium]|nr:phosphatidate cytidylyltransferase [Opitutales bacterium]